MAWFRSRRDGLEARLDRELRDHVALEAEDNGGNPNAARRALGNRTLISEDTRAEWGGVWRERLVRDVALAMRNVARSPLLSLGVAITLGLGIGATTTVYAIVDGVMLRRLPYDEPSTLVTVGAVSGAFVAPGVQDLGPISILHYQQLRRRARTFDTLAAINVRRLMPLASTDGGETEVRAHEVSSGLFEMLGTTTPALGRLFLPGEYSTPQEGAVMVAFEEWQGRYGGDHGIIGRTIGRIRGGRFPAVVVGVLPPNFHPLEALFASGERPAYYFPRAAEILPEDRGSEPWYVLGRLRSGVSIDQARADIARVAAEVAREYPDAVGLRERSGSLYRLGLNGLHAQTVGANAQVLGMFLGAAALLLALAAMNAATLLLSRSLDRSKEFAVRMALGAGRARVAQLILLEAGVLAIAGGLLGTLIAYGGVEAFLRFAPSSIPRLNAITLDTRALAITAITAISSASPSGCSRHSGSRDGAPCRPCRQAAVHWPSPCHAFALRSSPARWRWRSCCLPAPACSSTHSSACAPSIPASNWIDS